MSIRLNVPFVSQLNFGHGGAQNDPTGCWYASACMVAYYFEAGPRQGVPELYTGTIANPILRTLAQAKVGTGGHVATGSSEAAFLRGLHGVTESEHDLLARREHLVPVDHCALPYSYPTAELEENLRKFGPIFFYWRKTAGGSTYGHASVMFGIDDKTGTVEYHDPESAPNSSMGLAQFNLLRQVWQYALMRRQGLANRARLFGG